MRRIRTDRRTVLKLLASSGIPWLIPTVCRPSFAKNESKRIAEPEAAEPEASVVPDPPDTEIPTLPLFSCIEPSLGDLWGRAAVISQFAIVPEASTIADTVTLVTCGDDHWLRMWRISLTTPVAVPAVLTEVERVPGKTAPIPEHEPVWVRQGGPETHEDWVYAVAVTPDGRQMISGDAKGRILSWKLNATGTPEEPPQILRGRGPAILSAVSCPGSGDFVLVGENGLVRRYRAAGMDEDSRSFNGAIGTLRSVDASPDGQWLAVCGDRGEVVIYSARSGSVVSRFATNGRRLRCVRFSPNGTQLVVAGDAGITYLCEFDSASGTITKRGALARQIGRIYSLVWLGDRYVASGASDGKIRIIDLNIRNVVMRSDTEGHDGTVNAMCWLAETSTLISGGYDTTIRLWRPKLPK